MGSFGTAGSRGNPAGNAEADGDSATGTDDDALGGGPDALPDGAAGGRMAIPQMSTCPEVHLSGDVTAVEQAGQSCASEIRPLATRAIPEQGRLSAHCLHSTDACASVSRRRTCCVHASVDTSISMAWQPAAR